ncbi:neurotrimin, partial [Aphis craccivora]
SNKSDNTLKRSSARLFRIKKTGNVYNIASAKTIAVVAYCTLKLNTINSRPPSPFISTHYFSLLTVFKLHIHNVEGPVLNLTRISRSHMGAYLCIASNGVPPSVSKRIMLVVNFPPMIWIQNQLIGAFIGQSLTLECLSEAHPKSINYWTREAGEIIAHGKQNTSGE